MKPQSECGGQQIIHRFYLTHLGGGHNRCKQIVFGRICQDCQTPLRVKLAGHSLSKQYDEFPGYENKLRNWYEQGTRVISLAACGELRISDKHN
jgi:hypothetical protein